jgi:transposase
MGDERRGGGPKGINWLAVRTYFVEGHTIAECAKRFRVSRQVVSSRAAKENWRERLDANVTAANEQLNELDVEKKTEVLVRHATIADSLATAIEDGLKALLTDPKLTSRNRAETIKVYVEAADKALRLGRDVRGIRVGQPSVQSNEADEGIVFTIDEEALEQARQLA